MTFFFFYYKIHIYWACYTICTTTFLWIKIVYFLRSIGTIKLTRAAFARNLCWQNALSLCDDFPPLQKWEWFSSLTCWLVEIGRYVGLVGNSTIFIYLHIFRWDWSGCGKLFTSRFLVNVIFLYYISEFLETSRKISLNSW